jgi:hypothetical protein
MLRIARNEQNKRKKLPNCSISAAKNQTQDQWLMRFQFLLSQKNRYISMLSTFGRRFFQLSLSP